MEIEQELAIMTVLTVLLAILIYHLYKRYGWKLTAFGRHSTDLGSDLIEVAVEGNRGDATGADRPMEGGEDGSNGLTEEEIESLLWWYRVQHAKVVRQHEESVRKLNDYSQKYITSDCSVFRNEIQKSIAYYQQEVNYHKESMSSLSISIEQTKKLIKNVNSPALTGDPFEVVTHHVEVPYSGGLRVENSVLAEGGNQGQNHDEANREVYPGAIEATMNLTGKYEDKDKTLGNSDENNAERSDEVLDHPLVFEETANQRKVNKTSAKVNGVEVHNGIKEPVEIKLSTPSAVGEIGSQRNSSRMQDVSISYQSDGTCGSQRVILSINDAPNPAHVPLRVVQQETEHGLVLQISTEQGQQNIVPGNAAQENTTGLQETNQLC